MDEVERIFELVDRKYKEQKDFAHDIGVTPSIVSEWRRRKSASFTRRLPQIATTLGVSMNYLLTGEKKEPGATPGPQPDILEKFNALSPDDKDEVRAIIELKLAKKNRAP